MPQLDIRTLSLLALISSLVLAAGLQFVSRVIREDENLRWWARGITAAGGGFVLLALRGAVPDIFSIVLANALIVGGYAHVFLGLRRFLGRPVTIRWDFVAAAALVAAFVPFTYVAPNLPARIVIVSGVIGSICLAAARMLLAAEAAQARPVLRLLGAGILACGLFSLLRAVLTPFAGVGDDYVQLRDWLHTIPLLIPVLMHVLLGVGLPILVAGRMQEAVRELNETLEHRVADRTAALTSALNELESFSYSASHDLRTPLRAIEGFAAILEIDYGERLGAPGREHLHRVRAAAQRMATLLDDILDLALLSRRELHWCMVDLSALAATVMNNLVREEPARRVTVSIQPGLEARCDSQLMAIALQHLLGNAWKFTAQRPDARIEFCREQGEGRMAYCVRDNGAGFDMQYAGGLFRPFHRLHGSSEFPGNGIGLAMVSRIITRHGGEVWGQGVVGQGASFCFSLGSAGDGLAAPGPQEAYAESTAAARVAPMAAPASTSLG